MKCPRLGTAVSTFLFSAQQASEHFQQGLLAVCSAVKVSIQPGWALADQHFNCSTSILVVVFLAMAQTYDSDPLCAALRFSQAISVQCIHLLHAP